MPAEKAMRQVTWHGKSDTREVVPKVEKDSVSQTPVKYYPTFPLFFISIFSFYLLLLLLPSSSVYSHLQLSL